MLSRAELTFLGGLPAQADQNPPKQPNPPLRRRAPAPFQPTHQAARPPATEPRSTLTQPLAAAMAQIHSTGVPLNTAYGQVDGVDGRWGSR